MPTVPSAVPPAAPIGAPVAAPDAVPSVAARVASDAAHVAAHADADADAVTGRSALGSALTAAVAAATACPACALVADSAAARGGAVSEPLTCRYRRRRSPSLPLRASAARRNAAGLSAAAVARGRGPSRPAPPSGVSKHPTSCCGRVRPVCAAA